MEREEPRTGYALAGLVAGALVWVLSVGALALALRENWSAGELARLHRTGETVSALRALHSAAVFWALGFTLLQLGSFLTFAFALRAFWRLRTAICYTAGAVLVMAGDALGLLGLLVWLGFTYGAA